MASPDFLVGWVPPGIELGTVIGMQGSLVSGNNLPGITSLTISHTTSREGYLLLDCQDLVSVSFPNLTGMTDAGTLEISGPALTTISMDGMGTANDINSQVGTGLFINGTTIGFTTAVLASVSFASLSSLVASLELNGIGSLNSISFPALTATGTGLSITNSSLVNVAFPALVDVGGDFNFSTTGALLTFTAPLLIDVAGSVNFSNCSNMTSLDLPNLATLGAGFNISFCSDLVTLDLGSLETVDTLNMTGCTSLAALTLNSLTSVTGSVQGQGCTSLTLISLLGDPAFQGDIDFSGCTSLAQITINLGFSFNPGSTSNIDFSNCALNTASVDVILHFALVSGLNSTTIDLSGGTNSAPSVTGQADKAALILAGCTVNTN